MKMKSSLYKCVVLLLSTGFLGIPQIGQGQIDTAVEQLNEQNAKSYVQPLITALGNVLNAGWYRSATIPRAGLHFYVGLVGMANFVLDKDRTFWAIPPPPFLPTPVKTATALGDEGTEIRTKREHLKFPDGLNTTKVFPMIAPQVEIGAILGTVISARYFTAESEDGYVPEFSLWGLGVRHSLSQYFFLCPFNLTASVFYQQFKMEDILLVKTISFGIQASKSFALLDVYGGVLLENSHADVNYFYVYRGSSCPISFSLKGRDKHKITAGVAFKLAGLILLNADYSLGTRNVATLGIGLGL